MQELETAERTEPSEGDEEEEEEEEEVGGGDLLDVLFEKEQGAVRRAGWLSFKALIGVNKDRKLELVARRRWRHYWVTLKGEPHLQAGVSEFVLRKTDPDLC